MAAVDSGHTTVDQERLDRVVRSAVQLVVVALFLMQLAFLAAPGGPPSVLGLPLVSGVFLAIGFQQGILGNLHPRTPIHRGLLQTGALGLGILAIVIFWTQRESLVRTIASLALYTMAAFVLGVSMARLRSDRPERASLREPSSAVLAVISVTSIIFWSVTRHLGGAASYIPAVVSVVAVGVLLQRGRRGYMNRAGGTGAH